MPNEKIQAELDALRDPATGLLVAETVHDWAKSHPDSALFKSLEWDNKKAGYQWRLHQIRQLIIINMVNVDGQRTHVSLRVDRANPGGGYRAIRDVVRVPNLVDLMLDDAMRDAEHFITKYNQLREIAGESTNNLFNLMQAWVDQKRQEKESRKEAAD